MSEQGMDEVTLRAFINSVWFKGISRGAMIFTSIAFAVFVGAWALVAGNTAKHVDAIDAQVQSVSAAQSSRAHDNDQFQDQTAADLTAMKADIANLKVDVRVVRGLLQQMAAAQPNPHAAAKAPEPSPGLRLLPEAQEVAIRP